jgi:hypothetical protein
MKKGIFHLLTSVDQGTTEDKGMLTKEAFFMGFPLSFVVPWLTEVKGFLVVQASLILRRWIGNSHQPVRGNLSSYLIVSASLHNSKL